MFDRTFILPGRTETRYVTREVREHRAPTDESVRLLREMEQAADANRIAAMKLEGNAFKGFVEVTLDNGSYSTVARAIFDLNGKRLTASASTDGLVDPSAGLMLKLRAAMAEKIASEVLADSLSCFPKRLSAQGMSARESRDPQGLGPQAASPVAESDAPDNSLPSHNQERI